MADIRFTEETIRYVSVFQKVTKSTVKDCLDTPERIIFVVKEGEGGKAIGRGGKNVLRLKDMLHKEVRIVEYSPLPEQFLRNIFKTYKVKNVEIDERENGPHATVSVEATQKGLAIGRDASNLKIARELLSRHHKIDSVSIA